MTSTSGAYCAYDFADLCIPSQRFAHVWYQQFVNTIVSSCLQPTHPTCATGRSQQLDTADPSAARSVRPRPSGADRSCTKYWPAFTCHLELKSRSAIRRESLLLLEGTLCTRQPRTHSSTRTSAALLCGGASTGDGMCSSTYHV